MTDHIWADFKTEIFGFIKSRIQRKEDAEDILQDVFVKIHQHVDTIKDTSKISSWVYQITRNAIIDYYRKKKITFAEIELSAPVPESDTSILADFTPCIRPFIAQLPEKYGKILMQLTFEKITLKEYAEINGLTYSAAKSRVQRARKKLNDLFVSCCNVTSDHYGNIIDSNQGNCSC